MWFWVILLAVGTFVIAAAAVGSVTGTLAQRPRRSVYDLAEATHFVADRLPDEVTARLSYDDVEAVLGAHCDYLTARGLASGRASDDIGEDLVLISEDDSTAWIIGSLEEAGLEIPDEDVVVVLEVEQDYYHAIGMFGPEVADAGPGFV
ncbi:MAG: hypothetical protein M5U19_05670 [Microthrixaceae bacterium]|nr:hypothetical protein [Microthrixaceae bacterium]